MARELRRRTSPQGTDEVWCVVRRRYVITQPEELVRQAATLYLEGLGYPTGLMQIERGVPGSRNRSDLLVWDREGAPYLLLEAKRPDVSHLSGVAQLADYQRTVGAAYAVAVNGVRGVGVKFDVEKGRVDFLE